MGFTSKRRRVQNSAASVESKTYLRCPFKEKDQAKALGAKWDPAKKSWYVPAVWAQRVSRGTDLHTCNQPAFGCFILAPCTLALFSSVFPSLFPPLLPSVFPLAYFHWFSPLFPYLPSFLVSLPSPLFTYIVAPIPWFPP